MTNVIAMALLVAPMIILAIAVAVISARRRGAETRPEPAAEPGE